MSARPISELLAEASVVSGLRFVAASTVSVGGVDPLGLRQINFDLMDLVLPGLNNVAQHIRPFVVVAWAWRRARRLAEATGQDNVQVELLRDFVDRIEVIYAWSQFLRRPDTALPGRQVLADLVREPSYHFGGKPWAKRRSDREDSTAFTAAINYGPALKSMGWIEPLTERPDLFRSSELVDAALDEFEAGIAPFLHHDAFSKLGEVDVDAVDVREWANAWAIDDYGPAERYAALNALEGPSAPEKRRLGLELVRQSCEIAGSDTDVAAVRRAMCAIGPDVGHDDHFATTRRIWRRVQVRQAFRMALECLLYWITRELSDQPSETDELARKFVDLTGISVSAMSARDWLTQLKSTDDCPTKYIEVLNNACRANPSIELPLAIVSAIAFCLTEAPERGEPFERPDRLPLFRARHDAQGWMQGQPSEFMKRIIESWIFAQHVYWSVGRGLGDARANGKTLLRLRVMVEESGWDLTPGALVGNPPVPTPDRLETAMSLLRECR